LFPQAFAIFPVGRPVFDKPLTYVNAEIHVTYAKPKAFGDKAELKCDRAVGPFANGKIGTVGKAFIADGSVSVIRQNGVRIDAPPGSTITVQLPEEPH
jgi:hypothetical protein